MFKGLKLKVRKFWQPISTFREVTGEKLVRGLGFWSPSILINVNDSNSKIVLLLISRKSYFKNKELIYAMAMSFTQ